ncbi:DUF424 domain-containing protein [Candidatus Pacearchaeota archaeon]|nr:DUF424 domain-containing protein [Candidatus Pacearchaeota archaeon]
MFVKIHKSYRTVVAICDSNLIGKKFDEGKKQLHLRENFYKDKEVSKEELIKTMKRQLLEDACFNIVGKESITIALEVGIIKKEGVHKIKGVPFALVLL